MKRPRIVPPGLARHLLIVYGIGLVLTVLSVTGWYAAQAVGMGAAYKAKILCSGVFLSRRSADSVLEEDLFAEDLAALGLLEAAVDLRDGSVSAGPMAWLLRTARFQPGRGCHLDDAARSQDALADDNIIARDAAGSPSAPAEPPRQATDPRLDAVLDWAFAEPGGTHLRRTRAVVVLRDGAIIAERYAPGFQADMPLAGWSLAKAAMNALVGVAVRKGRLTLATPIAAPEWTTPGDPRRTLTVDQLLRMESGLEFSEAPGQALQDVTYMLFREPDAAAFAAAKPLRRPPGTHWQYASGNTNLLSRLLRLTLGEREYRDFPRRALFAPLGLVRAVMETDATGTYVGSSFMYATAREWARLGQLYLNDGVWNGQRILPEGWVRYSATPTHHALDGRYGAHFWLKLEEESAGSELPADAYHAIGYEGQYISVIPSRRLVVARLGLTRHAPAWNQAEFIRRLLSALDGDASGRT